MADKELLYEKEGNLAIITINRPERMNAFTTEMRGEIVDVLEDAGQDDKVRAIILTGTGDRAFCSGVEVGGGTGGREAEGIGKRIMEGGKQMRQFQLCIYNTDKPTFAAINGVAVGPGMVMALNCDFRIASDKARLSTIFVRRGFAGEFGISWLLPRMVGAFKARELLLTGDMLDAQESLRIGLVTQVVPHEKLMEVTRAMAEKLAKGPPLTQALIKRNIRRGIATSSLEAHLDYENYSMSQVQQTEDLREGLRSFQERREPQFKGQ